MPIETLTSTEEKRPSYILRSFIYFLMLAFLLVAVGFYFFIYYLHQNYSKELKNLKERVFEEKKRVEQEAAEVTRWKTTIEDYNYLLSNYTLNSKVFDILEKTVHPEILFLSVEIIGKEQKVKIQGLSPNFISLAEQGAIFNNEQFIENYNLSSVSFEKNGEIKFEFSLKLNPQIFKP